MKKLLIVLLAVLAIVGCQKKESEAPVTMQQEVVFVAEWIDPGSMKSTSEIPCSNLSADYALVILNGETFTPDIFSLDGKIYTQAIKMDIPPAGNLPIQITQFWLMHDSGGNGPDIPVMGAPLEGSDYDIYVTEPLNINRELTAFTKMEINVQVLCVQSYTIENFGFSWFSVDEIVIRNQCFFGDVCLNGEPPALNTPAYYDDAAFYGTNLGIDVPAIMKITVLDNDGNQVPESPFYNIAWKGIGEPLCIKYPDNISVNGEIFRIFLDILIKNPQGQFVYVNFAEFTITDDGPLMQNGQPILGDDDVLDFVLGTCNLNYDIQFYWSTVYP